MINLIPPRAKKSIRIEYLVRVASVWMILWSVSLFAAATVLMPSYVLIGSQVTGYEQSATEARERVMEFESTSAALISASQEAKVIIDSSLAVPFSEYIHMVESFEGTQVQIDEVDLSRAADGVKPIVLSGIAADRQALASFRDRLLADERVETVDLPISNLTSDKNINFNITITLVKEKNV